MFNSANLTKVGIFLGGIATGILGTLGVQKMKGKKVVADVHVEERKAA